MAPMASTMDMKRAVPIVKNYYFKPHAKLSVIVVIGSKAANYIKLVSKGYIPFARTHRNM
jgi:hypothetical protein